MGIQFKIKKSILWLVQSSLDEVHRIDQRWRTSGMRAIVGKRQNILGTPPIKTVCILVQNNKDHYEVLRPNTSDQSSCSGGSLLLFLAMATLSTTIANDAKFVNA
ncbi:hypothetical protein TNCV_3433761 [Trichonephila clavipes]|nr:hypothetical protein TNCV_3433761 [Trichonephila clavipes]